MEENKFFPSAKADYFYTLPFNSRMSIPVTRNGRNGFPGKADQTDLNSISLGVS